MYFFSIESGRRAALGLSLLSLVGITPVQAADIDASQYWIPGQALRLAGEDRYETATKVSEFEYGAPGIASKIVVASGENYPDALVAGPFAAMLDAPLLLTRKDTLSEATRRNIKWVFDGVDDHEPDVFLMGSKEAVSDAVLEELLAIHPNIDVQRIEGRDRVETAITTLQNMQFPNGAPKALMLVNGMKFADALAASGPATDLGIEPGYVMPILLNDSASTLNQFLKSVLEYYLNAGTEAVYLVGGDSVMAPSILQEITDLASTLGKNPVVVRYGGSNRYETGMVVAEHFYGSNVQSVGLATGEKFADALVGGRDSGKSITSGRSQAFLLTKPDELPSETIQFLEAHKASIDTAVIYGGTSAVSSSVETQLESYL